MNLTNLNVVFGVEKCQGWDLYCFSIGDWEKNLETIEGESYIFGGE